MKKVSIQEEDITSINIHVPNIGATRYIQQILTDITGEIHGNETIAGDTVEKLDLIDIFIYYIQKIKIYILLECTSNILKDCTHTGAQN